MLKFSNSRPAAMYKGCVGQEIFYCSLCQSQLRSSDFEKGKGYRLDLEAVCAACAPAALKSFPPHKREQLENAMASPRSGTGRVPVATSTPKSGTGRVPLATSTPKSGTGRVPLATPAAGTRRSSAGDDRNPKPLLLGFGIAVALILGGVYSLSRRPGADAPDPRPAAADPAPLVVIPLAGSPGETARDQAIRDAARKAQLFADAHPADYLEQIRLFEDAAILARGTGFEKETSRALDAARRRVFDAGQAELKGVDARVRDACAKEDFRGGLRILDAARKKPVTPEWGA